MRRPKDDAGHNYTTYAEQSLIDLLPSLPPMPPGGGPLLVAGNRTGILPAAMLSRWPEAPLVVHALDAYHARMISGHLSESGFDPARVVCLAPYATTLIPRSPFPVLRSSILNSQFSTAFFHATPRAMPAELVLDLLEDIHRSLADGASLYAAFEGDADDALKTVKKVFPSVHVLRRDKKTAVFRCTRKGPLAKYRDFSSEWTASVPGGEPIVFTSLPGCFCHRRADPGGLALAEVVSNLVSSKNSQFPILNSQFSILDMGCGCGLVGLLVADAMRRNSGCAPQLTLIDSHARAIAAARINAARLGLEERTRFVLSDDGLPRGEVATHDLFVGNPPYYSEYKIAEIFLSTAYRALRPGGQCFTVVKTATGLKALQEKYFRIVEIIPRRGYAVLRSVR